jgi:hypothetical protein
MRLRLLAPLLSLALLCPAAAQMVLPGAVPPTPAGAKQRPGSSGAPSSGRPKAAAFRPPPGPDSLVGKPLWLNGSAGEITFARKDKELVATELKLKGELISKPGDECQVDVKPAAPIAAKPLGSPDGLLRYELDVAACPITFDVLDGAILVKKDSPVCKFTEADCQISPGGVWGPQGAQIGPDQLKAIERSRTSADTAMRDNYRALVARTKDRGEIKQIAADQAGFSSEREETCRSYLREPVHGFCAARFTEARAAALQAQLGSTPPAGPKKHLSSQKPTVQ